MPEAILKFNLPEEQAEFNFAMKAGNLYSAIWDFDQELRSLIKYGTTKLMVLEDCTNAEDIVSKLRDKLREHLEDNSVNLNELNTK